MQYFNTQAYREGLARTNGPRRFDAAAIPEGAERSAWQGAFRAALRERLGLHRIGVEPVELSPRLVETIEREGYTREKRYITTEPGVEIPFYVLLPRGRTGPFPLAIVPHGHGSRGKETYVGNYASEEERRSGEEGERDLALQAVSHGYAVIAPDVRGFYEMGREEDAGATRGPGNSCAHLQRMALMYGRTLIGERVHDMGRLIDYALTRPDIDGGRIVMTGNSGGGTVTLFAAALDVRIAVAVPGSYVCTFEQSIVPIEHCPCNLVPGILELGEMYDIAGLIAPRPLLVVHGEGDDIYPIAGTRRAFAAIQTIYARWGAAGRCELFVGNGGHRYYKERVWSFAAEGLSALSVAGGHDDGR